MRNAEIAALFEEMADLLDIVGENPFRVRAYRNAARVVAEQGREFDLILREEGHIEKIPGIGADLSGKIAEAVHTDRLEALDALRARVPAGLLDLLKVPGLGPKRVKKLYNELKIDSLDA
jgi:DNA polymerase (family 10)